MAGTFFNYTPGYIDARFEHADGFDFIDMHVRMLGATVTTTDCNDEFQKEEPVHNVSSALDFTVYMSSLWCPFADYIRFLEAMVIQVEECSFTWDPEGPYAMLKWERRHLNKDGFLTVEWAGHNKEFKHRMMLETRQTINMLYTAFRNFVESSEYDPLRYERLTTGEELFLGLGGRYSLDQIVSHIKTLDAVEARKLIDSIFDRSYRRHGVNKPDDTWPESLDELSQPITFSKILLLYGVHNQTNYDDDIDPEKSTRYIDDSWLNLDMDAREAYLTKIFNGGSGSWDGDNLREMRSTMIENYLAQ